MNNSIGEGDDKVTYKLMGEDFYGTIKDYLSLFNDRFLRVLDYIGLSDASSRKKREKERKNADGIRERLFSMIKELYPDIDGDFKLEFNYDRHSKPGTDLLKLLVGDIKYILLDYIKFPGDLTIKKIIIDTYDSNKIKIRYYPQALSSNCIINGKTNLLGNFSSGDFIEINEDGEVKLSFSDSFYVKGCDISGENPASGEKGINYEKVVYAKFSPDGYTRIQHHNGRVPKDKLGSQYIPTGHSDYEQRGGDKLRTSNGFIERGLDRAITHVQHPSGSYYRDILLRDLYRYPLKPEGFKGELEISLPEDLELSDIDSKGEPILSIQKSGTDIRFFIGNGLRNRYNGSLIILYKGETYNLSNSQTATIDVSDPENPGELKIEKFS